MTLERSEKLDKSKNMMQVDAIGVTNSQSTLRMLVLESSLAGLGAPLGCVATRITENTVITWEVETHTGKSYGRSFSEFLRCFW